MAAGLVRLVKPLTAGREVSESIPGTRVLDRFFGIRDFKAKAGRDSGLKVWVRVRMPEITLGITRFQEVLVRDYGIEKPYWGPILRETRYCQHPANG